MPASRSAQLDSPAAVAHLRAADPVMGALIDEIGPDGLGDLRRFRPSTDYYGALLRSIVGQQLSTSSARAIYDRLIEYFGGHTPSPEQVLAADPDEMRTTAGLSHAKVGFLRSLAEHVIDGSLDLNHLQDLPDDEVTAELVAVKGIGPWSADLFLMFSLDRPDVLASGDLGIRRAVMVRYGLAQMPSAEEVDALGEPWRPYRTLACLYLWRSLRVTPV